MDGGQQRGPTQTPQPQTVQQMPAVARRGIVFSVLDVFGLEFDLRLSILRWIPVVLSFSLLLYALVVWLFPARGMAAKMEELVHVIIEELLCGKSDPEQTQNVQSCVYDWMVMTGINFPTLEDREAFGVGSVFGEIFNGSFTFVFVGVAVFAVLALAMPSRPVALNLSLKCGYACATALLLVPITVLSVLLIGLGKWRHEIQPVVLPSFDGSSLNFSDTANYFADDSGLSLNIDVDDTPPHTLPLRTLYYEGLEQMRNMSALLNQFPEAMADRMKDRAGSPEVVRDILAAVQELSSATPEETVQAQFEASTEYQCPATDPGCLSNHRCAANKGVWDEGQPKCDSHEGPDAKGLGKAPSLTGTTDSPPDSAPFRLFGRKFDKADDFIGPDMPLLCAIEDVLVRREARISLLSN